MILPWQRHVLWIVLGAFCLLPCATGCAKNEWGKATAQRREHRESLWSSIGPQKSKRYDKLEELHALNMKKAAQHGEKLKVDRNKLDKQMQKNVKEWTDLETARKDAIRRQLKGKPEKISETWSTLTY